MKTKQILNVTGFVLGLGGLLLKANHFPGANICIMLSAVTLIFTLWKFGLTDNRANGMKSAMNYFLTGTMTFFLVGLIFKFLHWPGAGIFVVLAYGLAFSIPVVFMLSKTNFGISRQFMTSFFTYFILLIGLFPNNPIMKFLGNGDDYTYSQKTLSEADCDPATLQLADLKVEEE